MTEILSDRVSIEQVIISERLNAIAAEGPAVVVNYDYRHETKAELPEELRAALAPFTVLKTASH